MEIYKTIKGFDNYLISNLGNIKSKSFNHTGEEKRIKPFLNNSGYLQARLWKDGKLHYPLIHRLVAEAFIPNPEDLPCINHIDEDKTNNKVENLEWCSREYNMRYGTAKARIAEKRGHDKRNEGRPVVQIGDNGEVLNTFKSIASASRETGTARTSIWGCCNGAHIKANGSRWAYLT